MKAIKRLFAAVLCLTLFMCIFIREARAEEIEWSIEHTADKLECAPKEEVLLSINLKGSDASARQDMISFSGTLEYDNSLFYVDRADILPVEGGKVQNVSFDETAGVFSVTYGAGITVKPGGLLLHLRLHVLPDAFLGRTTVCVTNMEWNAPDSPQTISVEHRVPVTLTIAEASVTLGDVNQDGKVDLTDAKQIIKYYNGKKKLNSRQKKSADVNRDGKVNLTDAKLIMKYYNGEITEF